MVQDTHEAQTPTDDPYLPKRENTRKEQKFLKSITM
jgi:hypothetical protein